MKKFLFGLIPLLAAAAFALVPSAALAAPPCTTNVLCNGSNEALRDDAVEPPAGGGYGASALAVNTAGGLRFSAKLAGVAFRNESPAGYAFFGVKLVKNPATANCSEAEGVVTFVDVQKGTTGGLSSPVYDNTQKAWPVKVRSDKCTTDPGEVTVEDTAFYFPELKKELATGTFTGQYVQPTGGTTAPCPGGGLELKVAQPLVVLSVGEAKSVEVDNGTAGKPAFLCWVSSNNNLFPKTAPTWAPFEDSAKSATPGLWKD